jgi:ABC-type sugar transport system ATPase subunit
MNTDTILTMTGVCKSFPGVRALDNAHIDLRSGEVHAVCGENGAGKSTLMKIICGVYQPDEGEILLNGQQYAVESPSAAYASGVAIIFQESSLFPELTVLENIFMGHELQRDLIPGLPALRVNDFPAMRAKATEIFDRLGMAVDLDVTVASLGVATKQMIEIAKALSYESSILILDEPTAALTSREVETLFRTIRRLQETGHSMLYISHRLDEIFEIADRVTVYRDGAFIQTADVSEVTRDQIVSWMVGRDISNLYPKEEVEIGETVLEVKNLVQRPLLRNVSFRLRRGEILGMAGLAGAGRTEAALAITGLTHPDSGEIWLNGSQATIRSYRDAMRYGIVYVSEDRQMRGLVLPMTVQVNTTHKILPQISNLISIIDQSKDTETTERYIRALGIRTPSKEFVVNNLSGGNQQKVSLARSLAVEPKILILDEPTRGVDVGAKSEIHRIISSLAGQGMSIILISSDLPEILGMADRAVVVKAGEVVGELQRHELDQERILSLAL